MLLKLNESTVRDLESYFENLDEDFLDHLVARVNLLEYINKLISLSSRIEFWSEQRIIGILCYYTRITPESIYISHISTGIDQRRAGLGTQLLDVLKSKFPTSIIELEVDSDNIQAQDFYKKNGFHQSGTSNGTLTLQWIGNIR